MVSKVKILEIIPRQQKGNNIFDLHNNQLQLQVWLNRVNFSKYDEPPEPAINNRVGGACYLVAFRLVVP